MRFWFSPRPAAGPGTKTVIYLASAVEFVSSADQSFFRFIVPCSWKKRKPRCTRRGFQGSGFGGSAATRAAAPKSQFAKMTLVPQQFIFGGTNPYPWAVGRPMLATIRGWYLLRLTRGRGVRSAWARGRRYPSQAFSTERPPVGSVFQRERELGGDYGRQKDPSRYRTGS